MAPKKIKTEQQLHKDQQLPSALVDEADKINKDERDQERQQIAKVVDGKNGESGKFKKHPSDSHAPGKLAEDKKESEDTSQGGNRKAEGNKEDLTQKNEVVDEKNLESCRSFSSRFTVALITLLFAVLVACICPYIINTFKHVNKAEMPFDDNYINIYEEGLQNLKVNFTRQTPRFWKLLKRRGLAHLRNRSPSRPLVFLLAAAPNAHDIVDSFATKLAELLDPENAENLAKIDGQEHRDNQGDVTKKILDQVLLDTFGKGKKAALVYQLNLLPPPSPMIFHSYCDDQDAPYKHAAFIFTVHLPRNFPEPTVSPVEAEGTVEKYLSEEVWVDSPYDKDRIAALLSRIADTVLLISPEGR